jgi:hypothetical protein
MIAFSQADAAALSTHTGLRIALAPENLAN